MIEFQHVSKFYKSTPVLQDINLKMYDGEIIVLIGPSGCGKTTTLKMINRLISTSEGTILINGTDISTIDPIILRRSMGYVIQQTGLFPHMTVRQNIEIIPNLQKKEKKEITERTLQLMKMVGLDPDFYLDRYPIQLSGGQMQRIGVARAFAMDPDIILMDEPFSALDPITRSGLQDELVNLQAHLHKTIIFVTHDMDEAVKIADRICIMNDGHILQYDKPEQILKHPADGFVSTFVGKNRIWSSPEFIHAKDIMIRTPVVTTPSIPMLKCIEKMRIQKVDSLMVIDDDDNDRFLGIVNARHILRAEDKVAPVSEVVKTAKITAKPDTSIIELLKMINLYDVSAIPILEEDGRLTGLITKSSLVTALSSQFIDLETLTNGQEAGV